MPAIQDTLPHPLALKFIPFFLLRGRGEEERGGKRRGGGRERQRKTERPISYKAECSSFSLVTRHESVPVSEYDHKYTEFSLTCSI